MVVPLTRRKHALDRGYRLLLSLWDTAVDEDCHHDFGAPITRTALYFSFFLDSRLDCSLFYLLKLTTLLYIRHPGIH